MPAPITDRFDRPLRSLRISVTDRCNLRCQYCMPEPDYAWLPRESILDFEEIAVLADAFTSLGVDRVRLTGGEPLLRRDLPTLIELLAGAAGDPRPGPDDQRRPARRAGGRAARRGPAPHHRQPRHAAPRPLPGARPVRRAARRPRRHRRRGARGVRVAQDRHRRDARPQRRRAGRRWSSSARAVGAEVRFIEYMDVGGATHWSMDAVVSRREILARLSEAYGADRAGRRDATPRPRNASGCRTARRSASSRRQPSRSAPRATAAG